MRTMMVRLRAVCRRLLGIDLDAIRSEERVGGLVSEIAILRGSLAGLAADLRMTRMLVGGLHAARVKAKASSATLAEAEFKVFSQFGDDGIIQFLVHHLNVQPRTFVEFGVTDYAEANTRYLLEADNWRGLVMDGDPAMVERIRRDLVCVLHDLTATAAFIDRDNINDLLRNHGFSGEIGLLSVDIDGNDYWVWEAITEVNPVLVVCEYNSVFGPRQAITVPYDAAFSRQKAHPSRLYYGASLKALCLLANGKGYAFVGSNSRGNNAYFVRRDRMGPLREISSEDGYVESRFRESVDASGSPTFISGRDRAALIADMPVLVCPQMDETTLGSLQLH
jgi:hypothetical protein